MMLKRLYSVAIAALFVTTGIAHAQNAQVDSNTWKKLPGYIYNSSDGPYVNSSGAATLMHKGQQVDTYGPTVVDDFNYGDGIGVTCFESDWTACATGAAAENHLHFAEGLRLAWLPIVGNDTAPDMDAASLDIGCEQDDDDGFELIGGGFYGSSGKPMVVGQDPAFSFCATLAVEDVSGTDLLLMGWREMELHDGTYTNYTDFAAIGPISGDIKTITDLANAGETTTDTTDNYGNAGTAVKYCVLVSAAGVTTYTTNGNAPTTTVAFTFADGTALVPFIYMLQDADLTGEVDLSLWQVGYQ